MDLQVPWLCHASAVMASPASRWAAEVEQCLLASKDLTVTMAPIDSDGISGQDLQTQHAVVSAATFVEAWHGARASCKASGAAAAESSLPSFLGTGLSVYLAQSVVCTGKAHPTSPPNETPALLRMLRLPCGIDAQPPLEPGRASGKPMQWSAHGAQAAPAVAANPPKPPTAVRDAATVPACAPLTSAPPFTLHSCTAWVNVQAASSQTHYDEQHNVLTCIAGMKYVWLMRPSSILGCHPAPPADCAEAGCSAASSSSASVLLERCNAWPGEQLWNMLPLNDLGPNATTGKLGCVLRDSAELPFTGGSGEKDTSSRIQRFEFDEDAPILEVFFVELRAGCSLYIPPCWWHCVKSVPGTAAISVCCLPAPNPSPTSSGFTSTRVKDKDGGFAAMWLAGQAQSTQRSQDNARTMPACQQSSSEHKQAEAGTVGNSWSPPLVFGLPTRAAVSAARCEAVEWGSGGFAKSPPPGDAASPSPAAPTAWMQTTSMTGLVSTSGQPTPLDRRVVETRQAASALFECGLAKWEGQYRDRCWAASGLVRSSISSVSHSIAARLRGWEVGTDETHDAQHISLVGCCSGEDLLGVLEDLLRCDEASKCILWMLRWDDSACLYAWRQFDSIRERQTQLQLQHALAALDAAAVGCSSAAAAGAVSSRLAECAARARENRCAHLLQSTLGVRLHFKSSEQG